MQSHSEKRTNVGNGLLRMSVHGVDTFSDRILVYPDLISRVSQINHVIIEGYEIFHFNAFNLMYSQNDSGISTCSSSMYTGIFKLYNIPM